jgi:hypothetical protein
MARFLLLGAIACTLVVGSARNATAGRETLRCGTISVRLGATTAEVLDRCGPPNEMEPTRDDVSWVQSGTVWKEIVTRIDTWSYDRGPHEFVRVLTFKNGVLDSIDLRGYGVP